MHAGRESSSLPPEHAFVHGVAFQLGRLGEVLREAFLVAEQVDHGCVVLQLRALPAGRRHLLELHGLGAALRLLARGVRGGVLDDVGGPAARAVEEDGNDGPVTELLDEHGRVAVEREVALAIVHDLLALDVAVLGGCRDVRHGGLDDGLAQGLRHELPNDLADVLVERRAVHVDLLQDGGDHLGAVGADDPPARVEEWPLGELALRHERDLPGHEVAKDDPCRVVRLVGSHVVDRPCDLLLVPPVQVV